MNEESPSAALMLPQSGGVRRRFAAGFSLVEVLAAVAIIGIITFLAIPNIIRMREDSEENLARSRASALHLAMASLVQANGSDAAVSLWAGKDNDGRYQLLQPYLGFAPPARSNYMPGGYTVTFPTNILPLQKVTVTDSAGSNVPLD